MTINSDPTRSNTANRESEVLHILESKVQTALPAKVVNINNFNGEQMVDVKPLVDITTKDYVALEYPVIYDVPVVFPSAGGGMLSFPIAVGDTVLLIFSKRPLGAWLMSDGEQVSPKNFSSFNLTDAIAIPGLYTTKSFPVTIELYNLSSLLVPSTNPCTSTLANLSTCIYFVNQSLYNILPPYV